MGAIRIKDIPFSDRLDVRSMLSNLRTIWENFRKIRNHFQVYNVLDYKTDNNTWEAAITAADYAASLVGGTILFPPGSYILTGNVTIASEARFMRGAILDGPYTVTFTGRIDAGWYQIFGSSLTVSFGTSVPYVRPHWKGGKGDGQTDDTVALQWALSFASNQYRVPAVELGGFAYLYSSALIIYKPVHGTGAVLTPILNASSSASGFRIATNATLASATANAGVDCTILIMDGGSLSGVSGVVDNSKGPAPFDAAAQAGIWFVNCQENYGKYPLLGCRFNGAAAGRYLNGVATRHNTTSTFEAFGGSYFKNGFLAYSSNICTYRSLFFEQFDNSLGNRAFEFNTIGACTIDNLWAEQGGDQMRGFYFVSCGNLIDVKNLQLGESPTANDWLDGVYVLSCSDIPFRSMSDNGILYAHARAYVASGSRIGADSTYDMKASSYGMVYLIENSNTIRGKIPLPYGMMLDELYKVHLGYLVFGTRLSLTVSSLSGAITTPSIDIYKLSGGTYTYRGTFAFSSFANAGDKQTLTFDADASAEYYLVPTTSQTGRVDIEWSYVLVNGNAFI